MCSQGQDKTFLQEFARNGREDEISGLGRLRGSPQTLSLDSLQKRAAPAKFLASAVSEAVFKTFLGKSARNGAEDEISHPGDTRSVDENFVRLIFKLCAFATNLRAQKWLSQRVFGVSKKTEQEDMVNRKFFHEAAGLFRNQVNANSRHVRDQIQKFLAAGVSLPRNQVNANFKHVGGPLEKFLAAGVSLPWNWDERIPGTVRVLMT